MLNRWISRTAKYSLKLEGERQWNINRKSRVLTKHVPANGAPGNASGMVNMLMVQSQAEFFLGAQDGEIPKNLFGVRSLFTSSVGSRGLLRLFRVHRETRTRGGRCHVHQTAWTHPQHPCVQNCRRGGEDRGSVSQFFCVGNIGKSTKKAPQKIALSLSP